MLHARLARDTVGGLFFAAIGLAFVLGSNHLPMGEAARMASGYFPRLLGYCLIFIGLVISIRGTFSEKKSHEIIYRFALKKVLLIGTALLAFAFLLEPAGLWIALSVLVFISSFASEQRRIREALILTVVVDLLVTAVFVGAIGLEINLLPAWE
ncbi:tripartite tricarboxylate transporter TctB family protein [Parasutterella secunda]|uniref:tripartite tricarboxylate transporter TctB family protein n=1 Tax=Parasutterella secunda TaxID=626947 RepID=UPI0025A3B1E7|nr:tripartite tricarboxylate transporter TctB family protein [Parasutterella secunda]MDM8225793.1 tripartite tricarboxylate transporter TctB family protein [Parasutterella secunda]